MWTLIHNNSISPRTQPQEPVRTIQYINPDRRSFHQHLSKALKQVELWHQWTGQLAPCTLHHPQNYFDGMPPLPDATPISNCKFRDMAKQRKLNCGPPVSSKTHNPGMAYQHMDLGFIHRPDSLPVMLANRAGRYRSKHVIIGQRGHTCYLLHTVKRQQVEPFT